MIKSPALAGLKRLSSQIEDAEQKSGPIDAKKDGFIIYRLTCPEGKSYIGLTTQAFADRYYRHLHDWRAGYANCRKLYEAFKRHPPQLWKKEIICRAYNIDDASYLEQVFIHRYRTQVNGYNTADGGLSIAARERIKLSHVEVDR